MLGPKASFALGVCLGTASASFEGNVNFASPSRQHAQLGVDVASIERRSWKRGNTAFDPSDLSFTHGVASGDPWPDSVILWTRVAPSKDSEDSTAPVNGTETMYSHGTEKFIEADANPVCVGWKVFQHGKPDVVASQGTAYTTADIDYTVKVEATTLKPLTQYNYQFTICDSDKSSPVGRTKTAPNADDDVSEISLAIFSCSGYSNGYFNVYSNAARKDKHDWVVHLGDYIYEYAMESERTSEPRVILNSLFDYRTRHGQHRTDPDLQLLSQNFGWIATWDDHELANNAYRDGLQDFFDYPNMIVNGGPKTPFDRRKANAVRAYFEWMPIRQTDMNDGLRVWRSFQLGKLVDLIMLDTRMYDRSISSLMYNDEYIEAIKDDPARTLMGARQEAWFYDSLSEAQDRGAVWKLVGNQIMFSRTDGGDQGLDAWTGYVANRNRTLAHLYDNEIDNTIFLSGDSHQAWVSDLTWHGIKDYDPETGKGAVGAEFAGTSVTTPPEPVFDMIEPDASNFSRKMIRNNEEMFWQEGYYRGYFQLTVTPEKLSAQYFGSPSVASRNAWDIPLANFTVFPGDNHVHRPEGGTEAEAGALKQGEVTHTNLTLDTESGNWKVIGFDKMYLDYTIIVDLMDILDGVIDKQILEMLDEAGILSQFGSLLAELASRLVPGGGGGEEEGELGGNDFSFAETIKGVLNEFFRKVAEGEVDIDEVRETIENLSPEGGFDIRKLEELHSNLSRNNVEG